MFDCAVHLARLRDRAPLVHNITNYVAMNVAANALLAIGASPAMIHAREEVEEFAALADALSINIGTLSTPWVEAMELAAAAATRAATPWVLDPVAVGGTAFRRATGARLLALRPTAIRGNASEIIALAAGGRGGRGVDSADSVEAAGQAAAALAARSGAVIAVSGPVDLVTDGRRRATIANGDPLMARVTALGCAETTILAAFLAGADDPFEASVAALACFAVAGEIAAEHAQGPGSLMVALLDTLARLDAGQLEAHLRVEIQNAL